MSVQVVHRLPDRIRLRVPAVRDSQTARWFEKAAGEKDGIHWARANVKCAGLVVRFDADRNTHEDIVMMITQMTKEGRA